MLGRRKGRVAQPLAGVLHKGQQITNFLHFDLGILFLIVFIGSDVYIIGVCIRL